MDDMFYLLNIGVSGIKNIKEEVSLSFYKKTVDKNFDPERYRVKAIYGENGSGKSAIITAVQIFRDITMMDNYLSESKTQDFLDEMINQTTQLFRFDCEFLVSARNVRTIYHYSIHIGKNEKRKYEIQYEALQMKNGNYANHKYRPVFTCQNGELLYVNGTDREREIIEKKMVNLLSAHPFIYLYVTNMRENHAFHKFYKENPAHSDLLNPILAHAALPILLRIYIEEEDQHELYLLHRRIKESRSDHPLLADGFPDYEDSLNLSYGVNENHIHKLLFDQYKDKVSRLTQFIKIFKPDLVSIDIDAKENGEEYVCDLNLNYGDYVINKEFESTGIKKLIRLFDCFEAASTGGIVFVDEMDSNLNDVYLCRLIEYFMYYSKGQLCFTTHNLDPMTVLKENRNAIDFLSSDNRLVPWTSRGNASPENCYKNGMIEGSPFNIDATDFIGIFGE